MQELRSLENWPFSRRACKGAALRVLALLLFSPATFREYSFRSNSVMMRTGWGERVTQLRSTQDYLKEHSNKEHCAKFSPKEPESSLRRQCILSRSFGDHFFFFPFVQLYFITLNEISTFIINCIPWYFYLLFIFFFFLPTLSLSHRVHKTVLYISVSFAVSYTGLL